MADEQASGHPGDVYEDTGWPRYPTAGLLWAAFGAYCLVRAIRERYCA